MSTWNGPAGRLARLTELVLWTGAGLAVLAAHVGAVVLMTREDPVTPAAAEPPAAIMIEFAEAPEAAATEEAVVSAEQEDAAESTASAGEDLPEEEPPEEQEVPSETPPAEEQPEPSEIARLLENVAVPLPTPRPQPPMPARAEKKEPPKKVTKRRKTRSAASAQATRAQADVRKSNRTAARQNASGRSAPSISPARWRSRLMAHLERRKRYPAAARARREQGTVYVRFRIDDAGTVQAVSLARSSGHPALDEAVLSLVRRASPVPAPPPGVNRTITVPVRFRAGSSS
ncbi:energy transducer TonB [Nitratireductor pacificus]|uniref:Protein TonB n=1 Tax=Nitratireductor pacificus pht-3B TaxID=391937 RepID=K2LP54_9HYPH|nr:energy transducer TonB [Nitratireductor pacificus]EKF19519.1 tonB protein [Nitratireductor pacificus pht-3B]